MSVKYKSYRRLSSSSIAIIPLLFMGDILFAYELPRAAKECIAGLAKTASNYDNASLEFVETVPGEGILVKGEARGRQGSILVDWQYQNESRCVCVWRPDALFRLELTDNQWAPRKLSTGMQRKRLDGPDRYQQSTLLSGVPLVDFVAGLDRQDGMVYNFQVLRFEEIEPKGIWQLSLQPVNDEHGQIQCRFDSERDWVQFEREYINPVKGVRALTKNLFEEHSGRWRLVKSDEYLNDVIHHSTEIAWTDFTSAEDKLFRLSHYGLAESLLLPVAPVGPTSVNISYGFGISGLLLIVCSFLTGRRYRRGR